jgi:hypothetical protein
VKEIWKPAFDGTYEASSCGRIRRAKRGRGARVGYILTLTPQPSGYVSVALGRSCRKLVHQVIANAFYGPCPFGKEVNHKDTIKSHNWAANLEYTTPKGNMEHAKQNNLLTPRNGKLNPMYGKKHSWETKRKMANVQKKIWKVRKEAS